MKEQQKQISSLTKEKDQTRSELMKAIFTKDKLENLCRELQRQNREIRVRYLFNPFGQIITLLKTKKKMPIDFI